MRIETICEVLTLFLYAVMSSVVGIIIAVCDSLFVLRGQFLQLKWMLFAVNWDGWV